MDLLGRIQASQKSLLQSTERDKRGLSLLDLAVIGDSEIIVNEILRENTVSIHSTQLMEKAVRKERPQIADKIFPLSLGSGRFTLSEEFDVFEDLFAEYQHTELGLQPGGIMDQSLVWPYEEPNYSISELTSIGALATGCQFSTQHISSHSLEYFDQDLHLGDNFSNLYGPTEYLFTGDCGNSNSAGLCSYSKYHPG